MSCFQGVSFRNTFSLRRIRRGSSKVWKKVSRQNSGIYSIDHTFLNETKEHTEHFLIKSDIYEDKIIMLGNNENDDCHEENDETTKLTNDITTDLETCDNIYNEKKDLNSKSECIYEETEKTETQKIQSSIEKRFPKSSHSNNVQDSYEPLQFEQEEIVEEVKLERLQLDVNKENHSGRKVEESAPESKYMNDTCSGQKRIILGECHENQIGHRDISKKYEIPSPIAKIAPNERQSNYKNPIKSSFRRRNNASLSYDLIDYSYFNLSSLMTRVESTWDTTQENPSGIIVDTPEKREISSSASKTPVVKKNLSYLYEEHSEEKHSISHETAIEPIECQSENPNFDENKRKEMDLEENKLKDIEVSPRSRSGYSSLGNISALPHSQTSCDSINNVEKGPRKVLDYNSLGNISKMSFPNLEGLVETKVDTSCESMRSIEKVPKNVLPYNSLGNISKISFPNLEGLLETNIDTSTDSFLTARGSTPHEEEDYDEDTDSELLGAVGQSRQMEPKEYSKNPEEEITVVESDIDWDQITPSDAITSIPIMKKVGTLFKKKSLKHLYKLMENSHKRIQIRETPTDESITSKFVINCYGPSRPTLEKKNFPDCC